MYGVEPIDFDGTLGAHLACLHPDDRERVRALMQLAVDSVQSFDDVHRVIQPNGTTRWFEVRAEPAINSAGLVVGLRGVSRGRSSSPIGEDPHSLEQV
jgi:PAS domain-containing protein